MDRPWESKPVSAHGHKQSHIPLINSSCLQSEQICFWLFSTSISSSLTCKSPRGFASDNFRQQAGWLHPAGAACIAAWAFQSPRAHFLSRALLPISDKAQQWFVMQLIKCLVPKSDSWPLLWYSCVFALPSAHWEP